MTENSDKTLPAAADPIPRPAKIVVPGWLRYTLTIFMGYFGLAIFLAPIAFGVASFEYGEPIRGVIFAVIVPAALLYGSYRLGDYINEHFE